MASKEVETEGRFSNIENDLKWHRGIGWGIAGIYAVIFAGFLTWYLPRESSQLREAINADTAKQVSPINERLAVLTATIELRTPDAPQKIPQLLKQNLNQKGRDTELNLRTISAIADRAAENKIQADSSSVSQVGLQLVSDADFLTPQSIPATWIAATSLLNYCSFLRTQNPVPGNIGQAKPIPGEWHVDYSLGIVQKQENPVNIKFLGLVPPEEAALAEELGKHETSEGQLRPQYLIFESGPDTVIKLDGLLLKNIVYKGLTIEYDGGPIVLDHVSFLNCTFRLRQGQHSLSLTKAIFETQAVSITLG